MWSQAIVRMLRNRGHEVFVVTYGEKCNIYNCPEFNSGVTFVSYKSNLSFIDPVIFAAVPRMIKAAKVASNIIKANKIDIVIASSIHEAGSLWFFSSVCTTIVMCHGYYPYELNSWLYGKRKYIHLFVYWIMEQLGKRKAKGIVCPSKWLKDRLINRLRGKEITVINNMLRERPVIKQGFKKNLLNIKEDEPIVISYNIMTAPFYRKAFLIYIEAVKKIFAVNKKIQFVLFGLINMESQYILEAIKGLPIKILGKVENTFELLSLADIFLHVSAIDTFSMITLEAMSVGLPVIATNNGALGELIEHNKTGILVSDDPGEIAKALLDLVINKEKAQRLAGKAKVASQKYSEDKISVVWENYLQKILETNN